MRRIRGMFVLVLLVVLPVGVHGQDTSRTPGDSARTWYEDSWTLIVERKGVQFHYIFYRKADNENDGIVIRLRNQNEHAVRYHFTVLFRAPRASAEAKAQGVLGPGEVKTGDADGLFWVPFRDGQRIGQVGLRGIHISRADTTGSSDRGLRLRGERSPAKPYNFSSRRTYVSSGVESSSSFLTEKDWYSCEFD